MESRTDDSTCPGRKAYLLIILGILVSVILLEMTSDDYFIGQESEYSSVELNSFPSSTNNNTNGLEISFYNLQCSVKSTPKPTSPTKTKRILNKVSGRVRPGRLTLVLGQSGSGKSTLMHKLLGRSKTVCSSESGDIFVEGTHKWNGLESVIDRVGYVAQSDILYLELTVFESVMFSANWRLPKKYSDTRKLEIVNKVLTLLSLNHIKHERIGRLDGNSVRLSGGERKRISIAMELVALPKVLLMDEPTSGLDSTTALIIIEVMKQISELGVTVVAIVHQPSERIFKLSDDLILLDNGEAAYVGQRDNISFFLKTMGYSDSNNLENAEIILDILAGLVKAESKVQLDFKNLAEEYQLKGNVILDVTGELMINDFLAKDVLLCSSFFLNNSCYNSLTDTWHPRLPVLFRSLRKLESVLDSSVSIQPEQKNLAENASWYLVENQSQVIRPGFKSQFLLWCEIMVKITQRKKFGVELASACFLGTVVGFVSGYNRSWSRKSMNNVFLSLSLGLLSTLGTVYRDDMDPVRRAADSGMILGAHELALLVCLLSKGWLICHFYSFSYFIALYIKTNIFICNDIFEDFEISKFISWKKFHKYYQFAHINHLNYCVAAAAGSGICVFAEHNLTVSNIFAIGFLITCHVFAAFSPNENQLRRDSVILGVDFANFFVALIRLSYVTYYLEAIFLWDPEKTGSRSRRLTMRYYAYKEDNKTFTCHCMFGLWLIYCFLRFAFFVIKNSNEFHSINDTPYFVVFLGKVLVVHMVCFIMMSIVQDLYFPFVAELENKNQILR